MLQKLHDAMGLRTSPTIFFGSFAVAIVFIVITLSFPGTMANTFESGSDWLLGNLGWFYILGVTVFLIYLIATTRRPTTPSRRGSPCCSRRASAPS